MILSVAGIRFRYNSQPVLKGVSFNLPRGRILAVLGVNGAGKSTLLRCLNRILKAEAGAIRLEDRDVRAMQGSELARHFGYVPQKYAEGTLSVFDMVLLGRRPYIRWGPTEHDLKLVAQTLELMNLQHLAGRPADQLSGGEMQKVVVARALAQEPEVLLLDEPTSNLDLKNQLQVMELVRNAVYKQRLSAVVSVHDINLAFRYADYFLLLKDGNVHTLASTDEITPAIIQEVYGVEVIVTRIKGYTVVTPVGVSPGKDGL
ncbi:MAG: iron ABC transporter ATP-binding protein [Deltaproteobacteria bacterium]|nr:MAG: iron ABC transporter ATP-binding protein [Deltaproteobacteria bacterium]